MNFIKWLALACAFMAGCVGDPLVGPKPARPDTSVTPTEDGGTPTPDADQSDSSPAPDAVVDNDSPPVHTDVVMNDATPIESDATVAEPCWRRICGRVLVITANDETYEQVIDCPEGSNQIGISALNCVATCMGDGCSCTVKGSDPPNMTALVTNDRSMAAPSACSDEFEISRMLNGTVMPPSRGTPVRFRRMSR